MMMPNMVVVDLANCTLIGWSDKDVIVIFWYVLVHWKRVRLRQGIGLAPPSPLSANSQADQMLLCFDL